MSVNQVVVDIWDGDKLRTTETLAAPDGRALSDVTIPLRFGRWPFKRRVRITVHLFEEEE